MRYCWNSSSFFGFDVIIGVSFDGVCLIGACPRAR